MFKKRWFWLLLAVVLFLFFCAKVSSEYQDNQTDSKKTADKKKTNPKNDPDKIGDRDVGKGVNFYSIEKEIALGKQMATEVERNAKIINDPVIAEYVSRLGQNIVRNSDAKVPFTIKVIDSQEVNAFALPGGFFFVNTGLIMKAETEAELAGVMAHEIAHVAARHGTKQATRGDIANIATIPAAIFLGGWTGYAIRQGAGVAIPMAFLKFSRSMEEEADFLGLQYMYKAGYDPLAFVDFFERIQSMEKKKPGTFSKVFSSHPLTASRVEKTQKNIQGLEPRPEYVVTTSEFNDVKELLARKLNLRKNTPEDPNRPTLKRTNNNKVDDKKDTDERPTLKRRDGGGPDKD
jgi:predicted Zn-dependent protease